MFEKPISILISPNTQSDDVWLAFKLLLKPWKWKSSKYPRSRTPKENKFPMGQASSLRGRQVSSIKYLEEEFRRYLGVKYAFSFNSGRSAFLAILKSLELEEGSEVLLQAFTCNAAVNPILWSRLEPVFVDCRKGTLNIDTNDLKKRISPQSRAVVVQHTFGMPANMEKILRICQDNNLILIEDCAHSLGAGYRGKKIGTFGQAAFFSFGRDKIISSVHGGMVTTSDPFLAEKIEKFQQEIGFPSYSWVFQQLLHPVLMNWLILPTYNFFSLGKALLFFLQSCHFLSRASTKKEKESHKPAYFPKGLPQALAVLALNQFKKLKKFNQHRQEIASFFDKNLKGVEAFLPPEEPGRIYMKYPILLKEGGVSTDEILQKAQKENILLDDGWRKKAIVPPDTNQKKLGYIEGTCPAAEEVAASLLNLPTHINISQKEAQKIVNFLKKNI